LRNTSALNVKFAGARHKAESPALLIDEVFPKQPVCQWVLSVPYPLRFLFASRPEVMGRVLGIVYRYIATHLIKKEGFSRETAQIGATTRIQRFGNALNLNIHFHLMFLDAVYVKRPDGPKRFHRVTAPTSDELTRLTQTQAQRIGRYLERQGLAYAGRGEQLSGRRCARSRPGGTAPELVDHLPPRHRGATGLQGAHPADVAGL